FQITGIKIMYDVIKKILCGPVIRELFVLDKQTVVGDINGQ
ncbi:unnamed protein product, partial [marine sediment metagenome]